MRNTSLRVELLTLYVQILNLRKLMHAEHTMTSVDDGILEAFRANSSIDL